jgi:hypothetical protein
MLTTNRIRPENLAMLCGGLLIVVLTFLAPQIAGAQQAVRVRVAAPAAAAAPATTAPTDVEDERNTPTTAPTTRRVDLPKGSFELVEWVVVIVDPNRTNANDNAAFKSTWPGFARGRRPAPGEPSQPRVAPRGRRGVAAAPAQAVPSAEALKKPSPVGVIRLIGKGGEEESIDVLVQATGGRFLQHWPQGKPKTARQLWEKVALKPGPMQPVPADAGSWFETLRRGGDGAASVISTPRWTERFLMYDAEFPYPNVLKVKAAGKDGDAAAATDAGRYQLANAGAWPMRDVEVYSPASGGGWRVSGLTELPSSKPQPATQKSAGPTTAPATTKPAAPSAEAVKQVFADAKKSVEVKVPASVEPQDESEENAPSTRASRAAATKPSTRPTTQSGATASSSGGGGDVAKEAWRDLAIPADVKGLSAEDAVAPWRARLTDAGLTPADVDVILATLRAHALDDEQLTVVYRLDPAELDKLLPLEVVPLPAKTTRVGLAIVINVDPAAGERIAKLIQQMGDPDWSKREAAYAKLAELGAGAKPKLTEATKNSDIEIVYRAERLLDAIANPQ